MLSRSQLNSIQEELKLCTGMQFSVWRSSNSYNYGIKIHDDLVVDIIGSADLDVDRENSFIRIVRERHPEFFL